MKSEKRFLTHFENSNEEKKMVRMLMMAGLVVGAYVAGYNEVTHVEVMDFAENSMSYVEGMMEYAEKFREDAGSVVESVSKRVL